ALQLLTQARERGKGGGMDVVKKQNAFAMRFEPLDRSGDDPLGADTVMPIVGNGVGGKNDETARGEFALDEIGSRQTGNAEERRQIFRIAQGRADIRDAPVDLVPHFLYRQLAEPGRGI